MLIIKINLYYCFFVPLQKPISLYNVDNKDKSLLLLLSTTAKAFQCKGTGIHVSTDIGQKNKSNSCEKKDAVIFTKPSSDMPSNFFFE